MAGVGVAPISARLASRGVRPRRVSAKRSWPPGCGRFPAASSAPGGDAAKGVIEDRVEEATASQPDTQGTVDVRKEGGDARPSGVADALAQAERESRATEVMPPSSAAPKSFVGAATGGSAEIHGASTLLMEGNDRAADGGSGSEEDGHEAMRKKKRWLVSAVNPPPKRRRISAKRRFPSGCGSLLPPAAELSKC